ncbi:MAG: D-alanyl-D-alanine carboxypeptidase family protein [Oscillospiraceae bacterium]
MKKIVSAIMTILMLSACLSVSAASVAPPAVSSQAYAVMDISTGQVLVQKGGTESHFPASITKIMTLALALEKCGGDMSGQVTVSKDDINIERGSSHIALQADEVITLQDAFEATVLMSANDAANVLASYVADGNLAAFPDLMNNKVAQLGLTGTHFVNAHGLFNQEHYTTACDMAKITQYAMSVPGFKELFGSTDYIMKPTNKQSQQRLFGTDNCMLVTSNLKYEGTIGGKSGWVQESGYTMVEVAQRDGRTLVAVVLASSQKYDKFRDCISLFDYCFNNFVTVSVDTAKMDSVQVPVFGGGDKTLGNVKISVQPFAVQLLSGMTQNDLELSYNVPDKYIIGKPFSPTVSVKIKNAPDYMGTELGTFPMSTGSLGEILARSTGAASTGISARSSGTSSWSFTFILISSAVLILIALVGGRIAYVAYIKAMRKKRKLARMRSLYGYNAYDKPVPASMQRAQYNKSRTTSQKSARSNVQTRKLQIIQGGGYHDDVKQAGQR